MQIFGYNRGFKKVITSQTKLFSQLNEYGQLTIFGFPQSQPTRSVLMLCKENNIPYTFNLVNSLKGDHKKPSYLSINPAGLVPFITDSNGFSLGESAAILQYIAETRNLSNFYPSLKSSDAASIEKRANINYWLHWHHENSRVCTRGLLLNHMFPNLPLAKENTTRGLKTLSRSLKLLDTHLANHKNKFITGENISIADLLIVTEFDQLKPEGFNLLDFTPYVHVSNWMNNMESSLKSYKEIYQPVILAAKAMRDVNNIK